MKKGLIILLSLIIVYLLACYSIPKNLFINRVAEIKASENALARSVSETNHIKKWMVHNDSYLFSFNKVADNSVIVKILNGNDSLNSYIRILKRSQAETTVNWSCNLEGENNFLMRPFNYWKAQRLRTVMDELLSSLKQYTENKKLFYGYNIRIENLTEDIITVCRQSTTNENKFMELQANFDKIKTYIEKNKLLIKGNYMSSIKQLPKDSVTVMTGIPTDTFAMQEDNIGYMQMPLGGHMLTVLYKGIYKNRMEVYNAMAQYISDYEMTNISLPYEKFIDNKLPVSDSSVVDLKIYYPVF